MDIKNNSHTRDKVTRLNFNSGSFLLSSILFIHLGLISNAYAAPQGGQVVGGIGHIHQNNLNTRINQQSQNMVINWQSYNVEQNERVQYVQPNSRAIALNRILGNNASTIRGQIDANGLVILVNPNGIFFGATSSINVGGLMASGLDIKPDDFMNGNYIFNEVAGTDGFVINSGIINAATGGNVTLLGKQVRNDGMIVARLGAVNMAAGKAAVVTFDNSGLLGVRVTKGVLQNELGLDPAVLNSGTITAEGGRILLSASVSQDIFSRAVNTGDIEQATSAVVNADGSFTLGGGADVVNTGTLDVSTTTPNQTAGDIVVIGENVTSSGVIKADSENGNGGNIELHAVDTTLLTENSTTTARATASGNGGNIKVLGNNVGLFDNAQVDASGSNGGGTVLIGGDKTGSNKQIRNAEFIYLGENTNVKAGATDNGDGGKLITFASDSARIYGKLSARGGANGGNGGFIETSGLKGFEITQAPDATAAMGLGGEWLIDPYDISIVDAATGTNNIETGNAETDGAKVFDTLGTGATLDVGLITSQLDDGVNVTITTAEAATITPPGTVGIEPGNITFNTNLFYTGSDDVTLTLNAANDINIANQQIRADLNNSGQPRPDKTLSLVFNANSDGIGGGNVDLNNAQISTNGGTFTATGVNFISTGGEINTVRNNYDISDPGSNNGIKGGDVAITATGLAANPSSITIGGNIITDGGAVSLVANQGAAITGGTITTTAAIDTTTRPIINNVSGGNDRDAAETNTGTVSMAANGAISLGGSILTDGQQVDVINSGSFTSLAGGTIDTTGSSGNAANGDVTINSTGFITIGAQLATNSDGDITTGIITLASTGAGVNGAININNQIDTRGGNINISGVDVSNTGGEITTVGDTAGNVLINATGATSIGGNINTQGGNVTVSNSTSFISAGTINTAVNGEANGNVSITATGTITSGGQISSNGGDVDLVSTGGSITANQISLNNSLVSNGGAVTINGGSFNSDNNGSINAGSGNVTITTDGNITTDAQIITTSGNVNLTTTAAASGVTLNSGISTGSTLTINTQNAIAATNAPLLIGGTATFSSVGNIALDNSNNNFQGSVTLSNTSGNISITDSNNIDFATSNIGAGSLTVNAVGITQTGAITQAANAGSATFNAGDAAIDLANAANNFTGSVSLNNTGNNNVSIANSSNLDFGASSLGSGTLTVNAVGISQTGGVIIQSLDAGQASFNAGAGAIALGNTSNNFTGEVSLNNSGANNVVVSDINNITLAASTVGQDLTVTAGTASDISQNTGDAGLNITGNATFNVDGGRSIILDNTSNQFNGLSFVAKPNTGMTTLQNVTIANATGLNLQTLNLTGDLTVTANGAINDTANNIIVAGLSTFDAGANAINLTQGANDFSNIAFTGSTVAINDSSGINIGDTAGSAPTSTASGTLDIVANGDITDIGSNSVTVTGTANLNAGSGDINFINTDFQNTLTATAANNITINDTTALNVSNLSAAAVVDLTAGTTINSSGGSIISERVNLAANTGINVSTQTSTLQADNTTGIVIISNTGSVTLESLTNSGDITFNNDANILMAAGSVNADYDVGNLTMTTVNGSFLGIGAGDINNADITAWKATFSGINGTFGSFTRPLVLNVKESIFITAQQSIVPQLTPPGPRLGITYDTDLIFSFIDASGAAAGEQLISLEELEDIDPAIFSDVRNYSYGQIAIRLPRDQLFEDELIEADKK